MRRIRIRRALLSVWDKTGLEPLARALVEHGCELLASGGTGLALQDAGLPVTDVGTLSGRPEAFGGRMKTLSFEVCAALLFDRERDAAEAAALGVAPIDLVACNLYPFAKRRDEGADLATLVENVDIGGPTLLRAAAKNSRWVAVLTSPDDYAAVIEELDAHGGALGPDTRTRLMRAAFNHTADYDAVIATTFDARFERPSLRLAFEDGRPLRYGENAHQSAVVLRERGAAASLSDLELLGGKALSHNNLVDLQAALEAVRDLEGSACAVVKHANPCGLAEAGDPATALEAAWAGDPLSAFGSVIAFNRPVDREALACLALDGPKRERRFVEVVAAPELSPDAVDYLGLNGRLRIVRIDPAAVARTEEVRLLAGAALRQDADGRLWDRLEVVTEHAWERDEALARFGTVAVRQVRSNAIVVVTRRADGVLQLLGIGAGQPNRVASVRLAVGRARETLAASCGDDAAAVEAGMARAVLFSDAFFPFPDGIEAAADAGIRTVVQPGGSIRDKKVIRRCNELGVALVLTGTRHFRH